jgi:hypothetical protein
MVKAPNLNGLNVVCKNPERFLIKFGQESPFSGPCIYFHNKTLERLKELKSRGKSAGQIASDSQFADSLYATLTAWGMHSTGRTGPKLQPFQQFCRGLAGCHDQLNYLEGFSAASLSVEEMRQVSTTVWKTIEELGISDTDSKLVVGSKALHHLIPSLIPPIDRTYTGQFFGWRPQEFQGPGAKQIFFYAFPQLVSMCSQLNGRVSRFLNDSSGFNTSLPKVVDNAIVGFRLDQTNYRANEITDSERSEE